MGNISPSQSDYFQATRGGGHGDYKTIVLAPSSVQELTEIVPLAFDLADKYRNPVLILGDGMLGQMMEPVDFDGSRAPRGLPEGLHPHRGQGPAGAGASIRSSSIAKLQEEHNWKLHRKFQLIEQNEVRYETYLTDDAEMIVVAYGMGARIAKGAIKRLRQEGLKVGLLRPITLWPFPAKVLQELVGDGERLLRVRDERRTDGGRRQAGAGRKRERAFLRKTGRRHPDAGGALQDRLPPLLSGAVGARREVAMATIYKPVYKRPKLLKEAHFHYCPGCGHGIINRLLMEVIEEMDLADKAICVAPAGCGMLLYNYFDIDVIESAHGRGSAVATGIKRVRPENLVFSYQGDGDLAAIGTAEGFHAANRGENITVIFVNNGVYGMTGGQMAPTTPARPGDHHLAPGAGLRPGRPPGAHLRGVLHARRHRLPGAGGRQQAGRRWSRPRRPSARPSSGSSTAPASPWWRSSRPVPPPGRWARSSPARGWTRS